mmetsp:Transcript_20880/g.62829  ORF Transcript_20880/g.62829 Transcript_20880/m.62829 type:complete len:214 (-) Transcript_20880:282-923(-)
MLRGAQGDAGPPWTDAAPCVVFRRAGETPVLSDRAPETSEPSAADASYCLIAAILRDLGLRSPGGSVRDTHPLALALLRLNGSPEKLAEARREGPAQCAAGCLARDCDPLPAHSTGRGGSAFCTMPIVLHSCPRTCSENRLVVCPPTSSATCCCVATGDTACDDFCPKLITSPSGIEATAAKAGPMPDGRQSIASQDAGAIPKPPLQFANGAA